MSFTTKFVPPLVMMAIGFGLVLLAEGYNREKARLRQDGVSGSALVLAKKQETEPVAADPKAMRVRRLVSYRITPKSGTPLENTADFDPATFDRVKAGDSIPVTYRRDEPELHQFDGTGVLVSHGTQYAEGADRLSYWLAAGLAALSVFWILIAPRLRA